MDEGDVEMLSQETVDEDKLLSSEVTDADEKDDELALLSSGVDVDEAALL